MPLKVYQKSTTYQSTAQAGMQIVEKPKQINISQRSDAPDRVTLWELLVGLYVSLKRLVASSNAAGMVIPTLFILMGLGFIYLQIQPDITRQLNESLNYVEQGTTPLVQDSYIENQLQYVSNPGADYFEKLSAAALASRKDDESAKYDGTLYISVPRLGINKLPIKANVESSSKDVYGKVLYSALAHFKGTSLPFADNVGNIVVYGHSAGGSYPVSSKDVVSAFTLLPQMQAGDEIVLNMDGKDYKYRMRKGDIVAPDETEIITGTPGRETLTLFTCYPPGNNNNRYVVIASPV